MILDHDDRLTNSRPSGRLFRLKHIAVPAPATATVSSVELPSANGRKPPRETVAAFCFLHSRGVHGDLEIIASKLRQPAAANRCRHGGQ
jgi:hypothetical protein